jgi:hypothetical protein
MVRPNKGPSNRDSAATVGSSTRLQTRKPKTDNCIAIAPNFISSPPPPPPKSQQRNRTAHEPCFSLPTRQAHGFCRLKKGEASREKEASFETRSTERVSNPAHFPAGTRRNCPERRGRFRQSPSCF